MSQIRTCRVAAITAAIALIGLSGCSKDESTGPSKGLQHDGISAAVAPSPLVPVTLSQDGDDNFLLSAACDVLFGQEALVVATEFGSFQTLVAPLPAGAIVKLQDDPSGDGTPDVYECDARDPTDPSLIVVDPLLLHTAKGNGPAIHYDNLTFDLNGHSIISAFPASDIDPAFDNLGVVVTGANVQVINSSPTVSHITKFAHNIDVGGSNVTVDGNWSNGGAPGVDADDHYGIQTDGGIGSDRAGAVTWKGIKSVNLDPILGQGGEVRRCTGGPSLFENNYLVGGAEGVFIRQCADVTLRNNFIGSPNGIGVNTRDAFGTAGLHNRILDNTIQNESALNAFAGISLDGGARNFDVSGNVVSGFPCGVQVATPGVNGIPTAAELIAGNTLLTDPQICDATFIPGGNQPPVAAFEVSCVLLDCSFTDASTDIDGTIASWSWDFGDGGTSTEQNPTHTFASGGLKTVTLIVLDNLGAAGEVQELVPVSAVPNAAPTASFTVSCTGLACNFTDTSDDPDGSIASRSWDFGDGGSSNATNPSHTYATGGTRTVTLAVTDNQGAPGSVSQQVTTSAPVSNITLTVSGRKIKKTNLGRVDLTWSGATGTRVDLWRDGALRATIANDGAHREFNVPLGTHVYRICNRNTTQCSPQRSVTF